MRTFATIILIAMLTLISSWYVTKNVILPATVERIKMVDSIFAGQAELPYQYRLLKPLMARAIDPVLAPLIKDKLSRSNASFALITIFAFAGTFSLMFLYLRKLFSWNASIAGIILLQTVVPLSVTGWYQEGDFLALMFYTLGFYLMFSGKDIYLPIVIAVATLNREQMVFMAVWYGLFLASRQQLRTKKSLILVACGLAWFVVWVSLRLHFGFKPSQYPFGKVITDNSANRTLITQILPLWLSEVAPCVLIGLLVFRRSPLFFKYAFLSLSMYVSLFFFNAYFWELAKFLPAFLVLIPMSLQVLCGEYMVDSPDPIPRETAKSLA